MNSSIEPDYEGIRMWQVDGTISVTTLRNEVIVEEGPRFYTGRTDAEIRKQAEQYFIEIKGINPIN